MATTTYYGLYIMTINDTMDKLAQGNETKIDNALHGLRVDVNNKKPKQTAKTDPSASGTSLTFLATFAQNANGEVTVTKKTVATMGAATASAAGTGGLVPAPGSGKNLSFLRGDGTWNTPPTASADTYGLIKIGYSQNGKNYPVQLSSGKAFVNVPWTDTTYNDVTTSTHGLMTAADKTKLNGIAAGAQVNPGAATQSTAGLMSAADKKKLDGIATGAQVNPGAATSSTYGLIKIGYSQNGKNYPVQLSSGKAFVNVPWTDTTYNDATTSAHGLMSVADKTKLNGIAAGAQVNPGAATDSTYGLIKTGYTQNGKNYPVQLSSGKAFVNVPWTDTKYTAGTGLTLSGTAFSVSKENVSTIINLLDTGDSDSQAGDYIIAQYAGGGNNNYYRRAASKVVNSTLVKAALGTNSTHGGAYLRKDGTWAVPPNTTYSVATTSANGLMSSTDKTNLNKLIDFGSMYTLVEPVSVSSTTAKYVSTYDSRSLGDYSELIFVMYDDANAKKFIDSVTVPGFLWESDKKVYLVSKGNVYGVEISYSSGTQIKVALFDFLYDRNDIVVSNMTGTGVAGTNVHLHGPVTASTCYIAVYGRKKVS